MLCISWSRTWISHTCTWSSMSFCKNSIGLYEHLLYRRNAILRVLTRSRSFCSLRPVLLVVVLFGTHNRSELVEDQRHYSPRLPVLVKTKRPDVDTDLPVDELISKRDLELRKAEGGITPTISEASVDTRTMSLYEVSM